MADLISREALIAEINRIGGHWLSGWDTAGVLSLASRIPAVDAIPVVRCKDCIKRRTVACALWYGMLNDTHILLERGDDFWCAWGERREENGTQV